MNKSQEKELTDLIADGDLQKIIDYVSDMIQTAYDEGYQEGVADTEE